MKKKIIYAIFIIMIMCLSINFNSYKVQALKPTETLVDSVRPELEEKAKEKEEEERKKEEEEKQPRVTSINPDTYKPASSNDVTGAWILNTKGSVIIGTLQMVGSILSVIVIAILGIKYMIGSVEEKAEYKKTMMPYIIGAIMVFGITNLLGMIDSFMRFFNNVT